MTRLRDLPCEPEYALNPLLDPKEDVIPTFECPACEETRAFNEEGVVACEECEHWFCDEECLSFHGGDECRQMLEKP
jgi:hypothetical protein